MWSLVQLCCGEGGRLQTNITGVCAECLQFMDHKGFASAHGTCAFLVYSAQAPGLSCSDSGFQVLNKGIDLVGPVFYALPRSEELRLPGAWRVHCPRCTVLFNHLPSPCHSVPWCAARALSQVCHVSPRELISGCNPPGRCQPSRIQGRLG